MKVRGANLSEAANRLHRLRESRGMTVRALGIAARISNPYISQLENGVVPMGHLSYERAVRLAGVFGIDVRELMDGYDVA